MSSTVGEVGEKRLLKMLERYLGKSKKVIRSFSEDCAVIDSGGDKYELMTVDVLIEGVHFRREYVPAYYVGRKGLKISLSDIFAMGGVPLYCLISLGIPPDTSVRVIEEIYDGLSSIAGEAKVVLAGGNVSSSPVLFLDVVLIGEVEKKSVLFRNRARPGDSIFVTGFLGSAGEGLKLLRDGFRLLGEKSEGLVMPTENHDSRYVREAILSHIDPPSLHRVARALAKSHLVRSMIDLSDGLSIDLSRLCEASGVGARIDAEAIPRLRQTPFEKALHGGEDFELLFTVPPSHAKRVPKQVEGIRLARIGQVVRGRRLRLVRAGREEPLPVLGFEHF